MKYLEMSYLETKERKELEEKGLYCYDLRHSDLGGEIACIEKDVLVNRAGSMVTDEEIQLGDGVRIDIWTHFMRECIINYVH